jgi:hypothetical protein
MPWNRMFVSAEIEKIKTIYTLRVKYSYYGLSYFEELSVHETKEEADQHLSHIRCGGRITYKLD